MLVLILLLLFVFPIVFLVFSKSFAGRSLSGKEILVGVLYYLSFLSFLLGMVFHAASYTTSIDPIDAECYTPFGQGGWMLVVSFFLYNTALTLIALKNHRLPPLTLALSLVMLLVGNGINIGILLQISSHDRGHIDVFTYHSCQDVFFLYPTPILGLLISFFLIKKLVKTEATLALKRSYSNKTLSRFNQFLAEKNKQPWMVWALSFPMLVVACLVLIIFGQDIQSIFTETTTWRFSQHLPPPIKPHQGHYLCTVAAHGNPKVVKPLRLGKRGGRTIIVNRQLLIANAFEEMIQEWWPSGHRFIRRNYDRYGYDLSKQIKSERMSNLTYLLMKPLEWGFLVCLYLFCERPEERIERQYKM